MDNFQFFDSAPLEAAGLNRQAIFNIDALPAEIIASIRSNCAESGAYRQLILIGHAGRKLWQSVQESGIDSAEPIDDFTIRTTRQWFAQCMKNNRYEILYPGVNAIGLQELGRLAGWHHATPFKVGIDPRWGTWYAYRALLVSDTSFKPSETLATESPCASCAATPCIARCPAAALEGGHFDFDKCITYRKQERSLCKDTCLARISCPVGEEHRYTDEQIRHSYSRSMLAIEKYY